MRSPLIMRRILAAVVLFLAGAIVANAAPPAPQEQLLLTPDARLNARIAGMDIRDVPEFGFDDRGPRITMSPRIPPEWTWCAALNIPTGGSVRSFFLYDGWLFTTVEMSSGRRRQMYDRDVSSLVRSNAFHVAYHRKKGIENETVLLLVSESRRRVRVELDSAFFGGRRVLEYDLEPLQPKFVNLTIVPEEFTLVPWHPERVTRSTIALDRGWRFLRSDVAGAERIDFDHSSWEEVDLPHTWNKYDVYDSRNIHDDLDIMEMYYRGKGWYRREFRADGSLRGKAVTLRFLGANQVTDVWLNGAHLLTHAGGYTGFEADVSGRLRFESPNVIAVRVDNAYHYDIPPHTADYDFYGGLYREVELVVTHPVHIEQVDVRTPSVTHWTADVTTTTRIRNASNVPQKLRLVTGIVSPYKEIVRSVETVLDVRPGQALTADQSIPGIVNPLLWDPDHPWMYRVSTAIYDEKGAALDQTFEPLGFRWYRFDADSGFFLNGRNVKLRGVNLHQDLLNRGNAVGRDQKLADLVAVKRMGGNFIRLAHYPHHPALLDYADSLGLLLWEEIPYINTIGRDVFIANAKRMLTEMIDRDRNHPAVILWGLGNEFAMPWLAEEDRKLAKQLTGDLHALAKSRDPDRLTVQAHNELIDTSIIGITDVQGRNRYFGWYEGTYHGLGPALDEEKKLFPSWKVLVSEYGAEGKYGYHVNDPAPFDHSETYQMALHEASWQAIDERPWVAGGTIWNMVDFGSFRKIGNIPHINQKGMMTADRRPKGVFHYYQSRWTTEPMVYIVADTWVHRIGKRGQPLPVRVYSNCEEVELHVDGRPAGRRTAPFHWPVVLSPGEHRLRAIGRREGRVVHHEITIFFRETE